MDLKPCYNATDTKISKQILIKSSHSLWRFFFVSFQIMTIFEAIASSVCHLLNPLFCMAFHFKNWFLFHIPTYIKRATIHYIAFYNSTPLSFSYDQSKKNKQTLKFRGQHLEAEINTVKFVFPQSSEFTWEHVAWERDSLGTSEIWGLPSQNKP